MTEARVKPRPRADALPEFVRYKDAGCYFFPSCLACPLPSCRHDLSLKSVRHRIRLERAWQLKKKGLTSAEVARELGISQVTVQHLWELKNVPTT
jgi:hypothetical protein